MGMSGRASLRLMQGVDGGWATVCVSFRPEEVPSVFLRRVLSVAASKVGSGDVKLASHVMVIVNVYFRGRAGRVSSDVLLLKSPIVLGASPSCWGGEARGDR